MNNNMLLFKKYLSKEKTLIVIEKYWLPFGFLLFLQDLQPTIVAYLV